MRVLYVDFYTFHFHPDRVTFERLEATFRVMEDKGIKRARMFVREPRAWKDTQLRAYVTQGIAERLKSERLKSELLKSE